MKIKRKHVAVAAVFLVAVFLVAFVATGSNENPPVEQRVTWDSPRTEELFRRACADCHSHETTWPWYARVPPVAWWVREHVENGREHFNVSVADVGEAEEAAEEVREHAMPLPEYTRFGMHSEAKLTEAERAELARGLAATFGDEDSGSDHDSGHDGD